MIAEYFTPSDAVRPSRVCRAWNLAFSSVIWRQYTLYSNDRSPEVTRHALTRNALHIRHLICVDLVLLFVFQLSCTRLSRLSIVGNAYPSRLPSEKDRDWCQLELLIRQNPCLSKITLGNFSEPAPVDFWAVLDVCTTWNINNIPIPAMDARAFWAGCRRVQELNVTYSDVFDTTEFFDDQGVYTDMKRITLPSSAGPAATAMLLDQCPNLTSFAMDISYGGPSHEVATTLTHKLKQGRLPFLDSLGLTTDFQDDDVASCFRAMSAVVDLDCSTEFGPLAFAALTPKFSTLRNLRLKECIEVSGSMVQTVLELCSALEVLESTSIPARLTMDGRPWACLGLKKLALGFYTGRSTNPRAQSSAVLAQVGRLTRLETLLVGDDMVDHFEGLDLRLIGGLAQLVGLQRLATLNFGNGAQSLAAEDVEWMRRHLKGLTAVLELLNLITDYFDPKEAIVPGLVYQVQAY
ncbi:hypothetical protein BG003_010907 [Podila horticola]|nr:hypothetical protein BG003_010907 [Podila horticola]